MSGLEVGVVVELAADVGSRSGESRLVDGYVVPYRNVTLADPIEQL